MTIIKTLLFALIAIILFYLYLEIEKTDNYLTATDASRPKYASITKEIEEKKKSENATHTSNIETLTTLKLSGKIPKELTYKINVFYKSNKKGILCEQVGFNFGIFGSHKGFYLTSNIKSYSYSPTIINGQHNIEIPLDEHNSNGGCRYKIYTINMEITHKNDVLKNIYYGDKFKLFFPKGESYSQDASWRHNRADVPDYYGKQIDMTCVRTDLTHRDGFIPNCHFSSTNQSFFVAKELKFSEYNLNIELITPNAYKNNYFIVSDEYKKRLKFTKNVLAKRLITEQKLEFFEEKIMQLKNYQSRSRTYLMAIKEQIEKLAKKSESIQTSKDARFLKKITKKVHQSIEKSQEIEKIYDELLYHKEHREALDSFNKDAKIDKIFSGNPFYHYQILHLIKLFNIHPYDLNKRVRVLNSYNLNITHTFRNMPKGYLDYKNCTPTFKKSLKNIPQYVQFKEEHILQAIKNIEMELLLTVPERKFTYFPRDEIK